MGKKLYHSRLGFVMMEKQPQKAIIFQSIEEYNEASLQINMARTGRTNTSETTFQNLSW